MNSNKSNHKTFNIVFRMNIIYYIFKNIFFRVFNNAIIKIINKSCITNNQIIFSNNRFIRIFNNSSSNKFIPIRNFIISICYNSSKIYIISYLTICKIIKNCFIKFKSITNNKSFSIILIYNITMFSYIFKKCITFMFNIIT